MKIAAVTATFPPYNGGVGNVAYHNARLLAERGHRVEVITQRRKSTLSTDDHLPFAVKYLDPVFTIGNAPLLRGLSRALRGADLIHLHYPFIFGAEAVLYAAQRTRTPVLLTYHNRLIEESWNKRILFGLYNAWIEPEVIKRASHIASVSADHFASLFPHIESDEVPNGVDTSLFSPRNQPDARRLLQLAPNKPIALFVGGLDAAHRFKNVPQLLRAASQVPTLQVVIVGRGDLRQSLIELAANLGILDRTRFDDTCTNEQLPLYYSAADITVLPSNRTESFGMVLAESMACETPVIATNLPGVRQVVRQGENGLLIPIDNDAALYQALTRLLEHKQERRLMGQAGRLGVLRQYDWSVVGEKLERACILAASAQHLTRETRPGYNA